MNLVDSCGWIEGLTDSVLANEYASYFDSVERLIVPTSVQFELYKRVCRNNGIEAALITIALTEQAQVVPLTTSISLLATDLSMAHGLSFANAIIYATARFQQATLVTSDNHFEGLASVVYFKKA